MTISYHNLKTAEHFQFPSSSSSSSAFVRLERAVCIIGEDIHRRSANIHAPVSGGARECEYVMPGLYARWLCNITTMNNYPIPLHIFRCLPNSCGVVLHTTCMYRPLISYCWTLPERMNIISSASSLAFRRWPKICCWSHTKCFIVLILRARLAIDAHSYYRSPHYTLLCPFLLRITHGVHSPIRSFHKHWLIRIQPSSFPKANFCLSLSIFLMHGHFAIDPIRAVCACL